jgi:hypothetical protein
VLADENSIIFIGSRRKSAYFRLFYSVSLPTKIAIFDGFRPIFVGFWLMKLHYFPVVSKEGEPSPNRRINKKYI